MEIDYKWAGLGAVYGALLAVQRQSDPGIVFIVNTIITISTVSVPLFKASNHLSFDSRFDRQRLLNRGVFGASIVASMLVTCAITGIFSQFLIGTMCGIGATSAFLIWSSQLDSQRLKAFT
jgi:hypothetical protein